MIAFGKALEKAAQAMRVGKTAMTAAEIAKAEQALRDAYNAVKVVEQWGGEMSAEGYRATRAIGIPDEAVPFRNERILGAERNEQAAANSREMLKESADTRTHEISEQNRLADEYREQNTMKGHNGRTAEIDPYANIDTPSGRVLAKDSSKEDIQAHVTEITTRLGKPSPRTEAMAHRNGIPTPSEDITHPKVWQERPIKVNKINLIPEADKPTMEGLTITPATRSGYIAGGTKDYLKHEASRLGGVSQDAEDVAVREANQARSISSSAQQRSKGLSVDRDIIAKRRATVDRQYERGPQDPVIKQDPLEDTSQPPWHIDPEERMFLDRENRNKAIQRRADSINERERLANPSISEGSARDTAGVEIDSRQTGAEVKTDPHRKATREWEGSGNMNWGAQSPYDEERALRHPTNNDYASGTPIGGGVQDSEHLRWQSPPIDSPSAPYYYREGAKMPGNPTELDIRQNAALRAGHESATPAADRATSIGDVHDVPSIAVEPDYGRVEAPAGAHPDLARGFIKRFEPETDLSQFSPAIQEMIRQRGGMQ